VRALPSSGRFSPSTVLALSKYATIFLSSMQLTVQSPFFLTAFFGHIWPSSGVFYLDKFVAMYVNVLYHLRTRYFLIKMNLGLELKLINISMLFPLWSPTIYLKDICLKVFLIVGFSRAAFNFVMKFTIIVTVIAFMSETEEVQKY
jgi:hypothetical protein